MASVTPNVPPNAYVDPIDEQVWVVPTGENGPTPLKYQGSIIRVPPRQPPKAPALHQESELPPAPRQVAPQGMVWQCGYVPLELAQERQGGVLAYYSEVTAAARGITIKAKDPAPSPVANPPTAAQAVVSAALPAPLTLNSTHKAIAAPPPAGSQRQLLAPIAEQGSLPPASFKVAGPSTPPGAGQIAVTIHFGNGSMGISRDIRAAGPALWSSLSPEKCYSVVGHSGAAALRPRDLAEARADATADALRRHGGRIVEIQAIVEPASTPKSLWPEIRRADVFEAVCPVQHSP